MADRPTMLHVMSGRLIGGAERVVVDLLSELQADGYRPVIACRPGAWVGKHLAGSGVPVEQLPMTKFFGAKLGPWMIRRVIRQYRPDIVHTHMRTDSVLAIPAARELGIPVVCTMHGAERDLYCREADAVIAVSQAVRADLVARGMPEDRVQVVLNGLHAEKPHRKAGRSFRESHGFSDSDVLVGAVTRLVPVKGHETLIRAAAACPGVKVVLVGYGRHSYARRLRRLAKEAGVAERFFIFGRTSDPYQVLRALDVFAMPSLSEGLPVALLEAFAAGVPVVASNAGGIPEVAEHGRTGLLVPPGDPTALANAINELLSDRDLARSLTTAAADCVRSRFTTRQMAAGVERVYQQVLTNRQT